MIFNIFNKYKHQLFTLLLAGVTLYKTLEEGVNGWWFI